MRELVQSQLMTSMALYPIVLCSPPHLLSRNVQCALCAICVCVCVVCVCVCVCVLHVLCVLGMRMCVYIIIMYMQ